VDDLVDEGFVEVLGADAGAQAGDHAAAAGVPKVTEPAASTATMAHGGAVLFEPAGAGHQGAGGAGADEQDVEVGEFGGRWRGGGGL